MELLATWITGLSHLRSLFSTHFTLNIIKCTLISCQLLPIIPVKAHFSRQYSPRHFNVQKEYERAKKKCGRGNYFHKLKLEKPQKLLD